MKRARPRFFLGLVEIGDYYTHLQAGLEQLGYDAIYVSLLYHPFYGAPCSGRAPRVARLAARAAARDATSNGRPLLYRAWWRLVARCVRLPLLLWAVATRDVFVFGFSSTFFGYRELPLLKALGKRIVYVFHGSDSRPTYLDGSEAKEGTFAADAAISATRRKKRRVRTIDRWADVIIDNPLSGHLHERAFLSFTAIGIPRVAVETAPPSGGVARVLHVPSDPAAKGTPEIRAAVKRLRARGVALELDELTDVPHARVLDALTKADFVVDQLYADVAMAGFAAEAASVGRAAIVGGYGREQIERALCGRPFPPVAFCHPDCVEGALEHLATDESFRLECGRSSYEFVRDEMSPRAVARRFVEAINGEHAEWEFDPQATERLHGSGLTEEGVRSMIGETIQRGGVAALCVDDKPDLRARLVAFAGLRGGTSLPDS